MIRVSCAFAGLVSLLTSVAWTSQAGKAQSDKILSRFHDEFMVITPGQGKYPKSFTMGSPKGLPAAEQPAHVVTLAYSFSMARYEVTQELWQLLMGENPSKWRGPRNSAEMMTWLEGNEFCTKVAGLLRKRKLLGDDEEIRLPSEAEWEYVCRAGTTTAYSFGDDISQLTDYAWFKGNSKGHDPPVGVKKANPWGFYDMHGYLWEYCLDSWHSDYANAPADGSAWRAKNAKDSVVRGGSWTHSAEMARSAFRQPVSFETKSDAIGFRCVRAKKKGARDER